MSSMIVVVQRRAILSVVLLRRGGGWWARRGNAVRRLHRDLCDSDATGDAISMRAWGSIVGKLSRGCEQAVTGVVSAAVVCDGYGVVSQLIDRR
jgi:hypothetical protein